MNAKDTNQTFDLLSLAQGDTDLKHTGRYYIGACPFCGGTDRFNLKQTPDGWRWLCRNCTEARYKTPIDYVMRRDDLDFKQALESMGGKSAPPAPRPRAEHPAPVPIAIVLPDATWQAEHWHEIEQASAALLTNKAARAYLEKRAIDRPMWDVYHLGFTVVFNRPAITIPWFDEQDTITAIKYRFIDDLAKDKSRRYMMAKGSKQILFGLHTAGSNKNLLLVEGEFNAISITKAAMNYQLPIDALSFGSETATHADILKIVADDYQHVMVWADDPKHANDLRLSLARPAEAICSPEIDGQKYDANTLLQYGYLPAFLQETIKTPSQA